MYLGRVEPSFVTGVTEVLKVHGQGKHGMGVTWEA